jgi:formylglycine-generating enzyme required for sulfatase activity
MELAARSVVGVAVPGAVLAAIVVAALGSIGFANLATSAGEGASPSLVTIAPHTSLYRVAGAYLRRGTPVDAPQIQSSAGRLSIMQFEVSQSDYARCVDDGACKVPADSAPGPGTWPVTGVSFADATSYAAWLSRHTGQFWRLPTDAEWAYAAGTRFSDDGLGLAANAADPSQRWRAAYAFENRATADSATAVAVQGHFGSNEFGVVDLSGNVWEWTSSCYERVLVNADGTTASTNQNCGVRVLEGQHRTYQTNFIRDAKGGGCAVGRPPDHLGFRLVEDSGGLPLLGRLKAWWFYR